MINNWGAEEAKRHVLKDQTPLIRTNHLICQCWTTNRIAGLWIDSHLHTKANTDTNTYKKNQNGHNIAPAQSKKKVDGEAQSYEIQYPSTKAENRMIGMKPNFVIMWKVLIILVGWCGFKETKCHILAKELFAAGYQYGKLWTNDSISCLWFYL